MKNIIEIKNLDKSFQDVHAVDDLSLVVKEGELFAFLGVNGAGKSTTISIMCGTLSKDGGEVIIDGMNVDNDMKNITKEIGVVYQTSALDAKLSVKDNLTSRASLYGITGKAAKESPRFPKCWTSKICCRERLKNFRADRKEESTWRAHLFTIRKS